MTFNCNAEMQCECSTIQFESVCRKQVLSVTVLRIFKVDQLPAVSRESQDDSITRLSIANEIDQSRRGLNSIVLKRSTMSVDAPAFVPGQSWFFCHLLASAHCRLRVVVDSVVQIRLVIDQAPRKGRKTLTFGDFPPKLIKANPNLRSSNLYFS